MNDKVVTIDGKIYFVEDELMIIVSNSDKTHYVRVKVLIEKSKFFKTMLTMDLSQDRNKRVFELDYDDKTIIAVISYINTGDLPGNNQTKEFLSLCNYLNIDTYYIEEIHPLELWLETTIEDGGKYEEYPELFEGLYDVYTKDNERLNWLKKSDMLWNIMWSSNHELPRCLSGYKYDLLNVHDPIYRELLLDLINLQEGKI